MSTNLLPWLLSKDCYPKIFWKSRDTSRSFGAMGNLTTPKLDQSFVLYTFCGTTPEQVIHPEEIREGSLASSSRCTFPITEQLTPEKKQWEESHQKALQFIEKGLLDKLVLSRSKTITLSEPADPWGLTAKLLQISPFATVFCIQYSPIQAFIGATPEMLYRREGLTIHTEALAATASPSQPPQSLTESEKYIREFTFVKRGITEDLSCCCPALMWQTTPSVIRTPTTAHLYTKAEGKLCKPLSDENLISLLHPTAAMGGYPKQTAIDTIAKLEPEPREHFSAPLGWIGKEQTEIAVAIRCAKISDRTIRLSAGAGIISGSAAEDEWMETEKKMSLVQGVL